MKNSFAKKIFSFGLLIILIAELIPYSSAFGAVRQINNYTDFLTFLRSLNLYYFDSQILQDYLRVADNGSFNWGYLQEQFNGYNYSSPPTAPSNSAPDSSSISERNFTVTYNSADIGFSDVCDSEGCVSTPIINNWTLQSTEILSGRDIVPGRFIKQTYTKEDFLTFIETQRDIQTRYVDQNNIEVIVIPKILNEKFGLKATRYGEVVMTLNGDRTAEIRPDLASCSQIINVCATQTESCDNNRYWDCISRYRGANDVVYYNGQTYLVRWGTGLIWNRNTLFMGDSEGNTSPVAVAVQEDGSPKIQKISFQEIFNPAEVRSVTRPLNSDVLFVGQPKCVQGTGDHLFSSDAWIDCNTYGISADGRVGSAHYRNEQSGFGGILGGPLAALAGIILTVALPGVSAPIVGPLVSAVGLSLLTNPIVSMVSGPTVLGTVENSNNLGVGGWNWWGGFLTSLIPPTTSGSSTAPTVNLRANSMVNFPNPVVLSWDSTNANNCSASGAWSGNKITSGTESITKPIGIYNFILTCTGPGGSGSDSKTVQVIQSQQIPQSQATTTPGKRREIPPQ